MTKFQTAFAWLFSDQREWVKTRPAARLGGWIALAAGTGLFLELAIIRWHGSLFSIFGFYKNFSLLSAFLGLGIGYAVGKTRAIHLGQVIVVLFAQLAFFGAVKVLGYQHYVVNPISELLTMGLDPTQGWGAWVVVVGFLLTAYVLNALAFVPLGQVAGALMSRVPNVRAYGFNLLGSLAGILAFTAICYLWLPPEVWFAIAFLGLLTLMGRDAANPVLLTAAFVFTVFCVFEPRPLYKHVFSPYQALSIRPVKEDSRVVVSVNQLYYQKILDLSKAATDRDPGAQFNARTYNLPFLAQRHLDNVLIVGAGTGNDVAAAMRAGASHVDAVEIDPIIQQVGAKLHPENPYQDPRVSVHINDARAFIRTAKSKYDLIVYGLLDSHTMLSSLSNVRLDSFVYTVEGFREARGLLSDRGIMSVSFAVISEGLGHKLFRMMKEAYGTDPIVLRPGYDGSVIFMAGPGTADIKPGALQMQNVAAEYANYQGQVDLSTDDWPFFYMPLRQYPFSYALILATLLLVSLGLIAWLTPREERAKLNTSSFVFFFLGAGFMLIETRSITELGLTFGNTWLVIAIVISAILLMAWAANWVVEAAPEFPSSLAFACLAVALLGGWWLQGSTFALTPVAKTLVCVLPLFFSGLLFSNAIKHTAAISQAMAANLFGSICGGLLEYHSMVAGFRSLYLLGFAMYAGAYLCYVASRMKAATGRRGLRRAKAAA